MGGHEASGAAAGGNAVGRAGVGLAALNYRQLCELIERSRDPDVERHCDNLQAHLRAISLDEVEAFQRCLVAVFEWLDTMELRVAAALAFMGLTVSEFAAFRARLVLAGRRFFEDAAADPTTLLELEGDSPWRCRRLLQLAPEVYHARSEQPIDAWTLEDLYDGSVEAPPEGYLEDFRERFPGFWSRFPWELGDEGRKRERDAITFHCVPKRLRARYMPRRRVAQVCQVLGIAGAVGLLLLGRWISAPLVYAAMSIGLQRSYEEYECELRACFVEAQRPRGERGPLVGVVPYRVIRLMPEGSTDRVYRPQLEAGLAWLEQEARRYGQSLQFVEAEPPLQIHARTLQSLRESINEAEPEIEQIRAELRSQGDTSIMLVVANSGDHAFAKAKRGTAYMSHQLGAGTYAHEILHLFGACDLYESRRLDKLWTQAKRRFAREMFESDFDPDEVSIMDDDEDERARVDRFTARIVGWA